MLGYLGYKAARGQWRLYQQSRKAPGGPWTPAAVFFTVLPFTVLWMLVALVQRQQVFWVLLAVNIALTWLTLATSGRLGSIAYSRSLERRYAGPVHRQGRLSPELLRQQAMFLEEMEALAAKPRTLPAPDDAAERERRVAALFTVACPVSSCLAVPPHPCSMGIAVPVALVRKRPVTFCHLERMRAAVQAGNADPADIAAQFGEPALDNGTQLGNNAHEGVQRAFPDQGADS